MPKLISNLVRKQISLLSPLLDRMELDAYRKFQDALGALGAVVLAGAVAYEDQPMENCECAWALPADPADGRAILYLHGGAYTCGTLAYARGFGGVLAELTQYRTLCVGYRLAPEHPFPAALDDAMDAYRLMLDRCPAKGVAVVGESAGGGLCYALALRCRDEGLPQPGCIFALSPWTDLTLNSPGVELRRDLDPVLRPEILRIHAASYAGDDLTNPLVSPLFADLRGLAPSMIIAGSDEIILDDSTRMAERLIAAGARCELHVEEGMWHVYVLYGVPEAREAQQRMRAFVWRETGDG
ncbi:MAG: alpha/beta hydrolase [Clostridiales bacterium]|nr:alpha/beta hydrolase [Clostridiales bacterium]